MSVESIITENLDIWTSAIKTKSASGRGSSKKLELYGIKKLRELILELAVRGKLVSQEQSVEKNDSFLNRLNAKSLCSGSQSKLTVPTGWAIFKIKDLVSKLGSGSTPRGGKSAYVESGIPFLRSQNVWNDGVKLDDVVYISDEVHEKMSKTKVFPGDILLNITGASLGRTTVFPEFLKEANVSQHVTIVRMCESELTNWVHLVLMSPLIQKEIWDRQVGMAIEGLSKRTFETFEIPIPPLNEQASIVEKVRELMSLCDQLESQTEASIEAHKILVKSLLETLTNAKDADELNESWQRISAHFDVLFATEDSIDQLKQTILQLAVMGKLVKQDPNDEPASKLLERIEAEKVQLIKDKKIKKQTELKEVNESDFPFSTPEGWAVVRLGALIPQFQNGVSSRGDKKGKETIVLRLADIKDWRISENDTRRLIINEETIEKYLLKKGDTLIIRVNGSSEIVGRFITVEKVTDAIYCDHFIRMRFPIPCIEPNYLAILGSSRLVRDKISDLFISTAGQKTVNQTHISSLTLSIPPIMEQKRISERVRYLVAICDELKSKLQTVQRTISNVADSVKANY